ncbi:MAG: serine--tRNA ligase, partial [Nitrososphaerota archaeon]
MLDIKFVRENPHSIRDMLTKRNVEYPLDDLLRLDQERRALITEAQSLKHRRNVVSEEIARMKKQGWDVSKKVEEMKKISDQISEADARLRELEKQIRELLLALPNIPHESVPVGKDENDNVVLRRWGEPTVRVAKVKDHIEVGLELGLIDVERAAKVA